MLLERHTSDGGLTFDRFSISVFTNCSSWKSAVHGLSSSASPHRFFPSVFFHSAFQRFPKCFYSRYASDSRAIVDQSAFPSALFYQRFSAFSQMFLLWVCSR
ncbi:hypothetical protein O6H91_12G013900 [Diphasiastrum complanatum]|uniref:Uncharacterized protein n=1 Tax=Diphasiastrum complanatum TaxID=34168 RepID=A0ACC2BYZ6_DIPCM|nr:hypothetical protein O6H91_12G013900 [Diphasiastrum complanatum]